MTGEKGITGVTVDSDGATLVVRWEGSVGGAVAVSVGPAPDAIDHAHPAAIVDDGQQARLNGLATGARHYVHVGPHAEATGTARAGVVSAERLVPMEGTMNFRDLGGYVTDDERRV